MEDISGGGRIFAGESSRGVPKLVESGVRGLCASLILRLDGMLAGLGFSSSTSDKRKEAKRHSSLDFSAKVRSSSTVRQPPTSASFSSSRDDSDDEWSRRPSSVGRSSAAEGRSSTASPKQEIEEIRKRTREAFSSDRRDSSKPSRGR